MKCPHCEYSDGVDPEQNYKKIDGDSGAFYRLPVKVEREENYRTEQKTLFACPKCGKTFIEPGF